MHNQNLIRKENSGNYSSISNYQGEPLNRDLQYGPTESRSCQDIFWAILFLGFWVGIFMIASGALQNGDPRKLASPFDPSGNQCGYDAAVDYPYLYFGDPLGRVDQYACISKCPSKEDVLDNQYTIDCLRNRKVEDCIKLKKYPTYTVLTVCVPVEDKALNLVKQQTNVEEGEKYMNDLKMTWPLQILIAGLSFVISFGFLHLMRQYAGLITWFMILGYIICIFTLGLLCIYKDKVQEYYDVNQIINNNENIHILGYILIVIGILSVIYLVVYRTQIRKAIVILKAASQFIQSVPQSLFVPFAMFITVVIFFILWVTISLYIYSTGDLVSNPSSPFGSIQWDKSIKVKLCYFLFALFWNCEVVIGMSQFIIASTCTMWYFSHRRDNQRDLSNPISRSFLRGIFFHFGSICFGSLILAFIDFIRTIIEAVYKSVKNDINQEISESTSRIMLCWIRCCQCCLSCFDKFVRYINLNAYIMIALGGQNFCNSAKEAFYLILRNYDQFTMTSSLGKLVILFGRLFICLCSALIGYLIMINMPAFSEYIYSPLIPTIAFIIIAFVIGSIFLNVYGMASDTLVLCLAADKELNLGAAKACPNSLQQFQDEFK